ncbi:MAG: GIY-YIG nuclease family protein, partial [Aestuariivirga sp.]
MIEKVPCVYIVASRRHGTLYIGVTSDLCSRIRQHKVGDFEGFTKDYGIKQLVWFEFFG